MGKAKPAKHTSAELAAKAFNATVNRGGGLAGLQDRKGGKAGHAKFRSVPAAHAQRVDGRRLTRHLERPLRRCPICGMQAINVQSMEVSAATLWASCYGRLAPRPTSPNPRWTYVCVYLQMHHDSKHPKLPWEPEKCINVHEESGGITTQGIAVRGSKKK